MGCGVVRCGCCCRRHAACASRCCSCQAHYLQSQALAQAADEKLRQQELALRLEAERLVQEKEAAQQALLATKADTDSVLPALVLWQ